MQPVTRVLRPCPNQPFTAKSVPGPPGINTVVNDGRRHMRLPEDVKTCSVTKLAELARELAAVLRQGL